MAGYSIGWTIAAATISALSALGKVDFSNHAVADWPC